uniref:Inositol polyphosphate 1-phosphatase n=1 Tax=Apteryx owenii TaxID=8824 RepID=A0A8B9QQ07_APTOW
MAGLLKSLVSVSEKAAHIARLCRQEDALFHLLVAEKTGADKNERFVQDFKTLADVLIQEVIRHDVGKEVGARGGGDASWRPPCTRTWRWRTPSWTPWR